MRRLIGLFFCMLLTKASAGQEEYYQRVTLPLPESVPFEVSGLEALPDGRLLAAIRKGEIWAIENAYEIPPDSLEFDRIAYALHQPLGLTAHNDALYLTQRSELSELIDSDGDGIVDVYNTLCNDWGVSGNYHEYAYGPEIDTDGHFWVALNTTIGRKEIADDRWRGWGARITPKGELVPIAAGMRSPCGLGQNLAGAIFFTDQQGNWVPTCSLHHLRRGAFYGHLASLKDADRPESPVERPETIPTDMPIVEAHRKWPGLKLPAVWFPYKKAGMSSTDILCDRTEGKFGPFEGQLFVGDFTMALISRVQLEKVGGQYQGACFPFYDGFQSAVFRLEWGRDGSLFVGETNRGWNSMGNRSYGLERLVWTGRVPFELKEMHARKDGFELVFTKPVDPQTAAKASAYRMTSYTYRYHSQYGSEEIDTRRIPIKAVDVRRGGVRVRLHLGDLREGYVHELQMIGVRSKTGEPLWHKKAFYTLNVVPSYETAR